MADTYPNRVGQLVTTSGTNTILVLGAQLPGYPRPLSAMFSGDGETAVFTLVDGPNYQVITGTWNASAGTITRGQIHEGWQVVDGVGASYTAAHLSLSGAARILAGDSRQALVDYLAETTLTVNGLTSNGATTVNANATFNGSFLNFTGTGGLNLIGTFPILRWGDDDDPYANWGMNPSWNAAWGYGTLSMVLLDKNNAWQDTVFSVRHDEAGTAHQMIVQTTAMHVVGANGLFTNKISADTGTTVTVDDDLNINGANFGVNANGIARFEVFQNDANLEGIVANHPWFDFTVTDGTSSFRMGNTGTEFYINEIGVAQRFGIDGTGIRADQISAITGSGVTFAGDLTIDGDVNLNRITGRAGAAVSFRPNNTAVDAAVITANEGGGQIHLTDTTNGLQRVAMDVVTSSQSGRIYTANGYKLALFTNTGTMDFYYNASTLGVRLLNGVWQTNTLEALTGSTITVNDSMSVAGTLSVTTSSPPASATATGTTGDIQWDPNYIYLCTAPNTWKRAALSTW